MASLFRRSKPDIPNTRTLALGTSSNNKSEQTLTPSLADAKQIGSNDDGAGVTAKALAQNLRAQWQETQRVLALPNSDKLDYDTLSSFYVRVSSPQLPNPQAARLLSLTKCVHPIVFYKSVYEIVGVELASLDICWSQSPGILHYSNWATSGLPQMQQNSRSSLPASEDAVAASNAAQRPRQRWCVVVTYALGTGPNKQDIRLELRDGSVDDYKVFMVLLCRALPDYIRIKEVPVVWKFAFNVTRVEEAKNENDSVPTAPSDAVVVVVSEQDATSADGEKHREDGS